MSRAAAIARRFHRPSLGSALPSIPQFSSSASAASSSLASILAFSSIPSSLPRHHHHHQHWRSFSAGKGGGGKKGSPPVGGNDPSEASSLRGSYKGVNVLDLSSLQVWKETPVVCQPDADYPDWIWDLDKPLPSLFLLQAADYQELTPELRLRMARLERRARIKEANQSRKSAI